MGLTADNLREGLRIAVHCADAPVESQFLQGLSGGDTTLVGSLDDPGTRWIVHETTSPGIYSFECADTNSFLEGRTTIHFLPHHHAPSGDAVGLAQGIRHPFTSWKVSDLPNPDMGGFNHVTLQCQGDLEFLGGQPTLRSVRLVEEHFSDAVTHWELIVLPVGPDSGGPSSTGDLPH